LNIEILEQAVADNYEMLRNKQNNNDLRQKYEDAIKLWTESNKGDNRPEEPTYETEELKPYNTVLIKYAIVVDTLGQDRILNRQQREYTKKVVSIYRNFYESYEQTCLKDCVNILIHVNETSYIRDFELDLKTNKDKALENLFYISNYDNESKEEFIKYETLKITLLDSK